MLKGEEEEEEEEEEGLANESKNAEKFARFFKISNILDDHNYLTKINGKYVFTALFEFLIINEFRDVLFALETIPSNFTFTTDPFITFRPNTFAVIGLRSLHFFLTNMLEKCELLKCSIFCVF